MDIDDVKVIDEPDGSAFIQLKVDIGDLKRLAALGFFYSILHKLEEHEAEQEKIAQSAKTARNNLKSRKKKKGK